MTRRDQFSVKSVLKGGGEDEAARTRWQGPGPHGCEVKGFEEGARRGEQFLEPGTNRARIGAPPHEEAFAKG